PDDEFPAVARSTFSPFPPPAYRLAEPGDTIDHLASYASAAAIVLAAAAGLRSRALGRGLGPWPAALALATAAYWHASTPGPAFDGWHGWGWRALANPRAPAALRAALGV